MCLEFRSTFLMVEITEVGTSTSTTFQRIDVGQTLIRPNCTQHYLSNTGLLTKRIKSITTSRGLVNSFVFSYFVLVNREFRFITTKITQTYILSNKIFYPHFEVLTSKLKHYYNYVIFIL